MSFFSSSSSFNSSNSYDSRDLKISDLETRVEDDEEPEYNFNFEEDSLKRHFYDEYLEVSNEIKQLKFEIDNLEHNKQDSIIDLKREYREMCQKLNNYKEEKEKKQTQYEDTMIQMENTRRYQEETAAKQYSEDLENTKLKIKYNQSVAFDLKSKMSDLKLENDIKIDKLNSAIVDIESETKYWEDKERKRENENATLQAKKKELAELLEQERNRNQLVNQTYRRAYKKYDRVKNEVQELQLSAKV